MGLSDIFSLSTLIYLGITLLLVGVASVFFMQRLNEQNHKIATMLGIMSTMAEEVNYVRSRVQGVSTGGGGLVGKDNNPTIFNNTPNSLIDVSDEDSDNDSESDSESDSDSDSDSESVDNESVQNVELSENIKTINIGLGEPFELLEEHTLPQEPEPELEDGDETETNSELNDDDLESLNDDNKAEELFNLTDSELIKSIDISNLDENNNVPDFKKMSLNKLRNIVSEKGLVTDASKLKKNDLLKLLGSVSE